MRSQGFVLIHLLAILILISAALILLFNSPQSPSPTPSAEPVVYQAPKLPIAESYRIMLVGDSMTAALGVNANPLRLELIKRYPNTEFVTYNYAIPSSNILLLKDYLHKKTTFNGLEYPAILNDGFDLIIIESFGHNPLSDLPLKEGLRKHNEILDYTIEEVARTHPESIILLMATIAPSKATYALNSRDLSPEVRKAWAEERIAYIKNHIAYGEKKGIPVINVYEKSLQGDDVNPIYVSKDDYIHPSGEGVNLLASTIADFIFENQIFPTP